MCFCYVGRRQRGLPHRRKSEIWNQPRPVEIIRIDQWTYYEEDKVVFCVMRSALVIKVDGFLFEGLVESRSSFRNSRFAVYCSGGARPRRDWGFNRDWAIDAGKQEVESEPGRGSGVPCPEDARCHSQGVVSHHEESRRGRRMGSWGKGPADSCLSLL